MLRTEHCVGVITWDVRPGTHWARCSCTDPPRILTEDEVKVIHGSDGWGSTYSFGTATCRECGATVEWDTR